MRLAELPGSVEFHTIWRKHECMARETENKKRQASLKGQDRGRTVVPFQGKQRIVRAACCGVKGNGILRNALQMCKAHVITWHHIRKPSTQSDFSADSSSATCSGVVQSVGL